MISLDGKQIGLAFAFGAALFLAGCGSDAPPETGGNPAPPAGTPAPAPGDPAPPPPAPAPQDPASGPELAPPNTDGASTAPAAGSGTAAAPINALLAQQRAFDANPFSVPDAAPEEVLAYIERLAQLQPADKSEEGIKQHLAKIAAALHEATDKMIAANPSQAYLIEALAWKFAAYNIQTDRLGDAEAPARAIDFLSRWKDDTRPAVAQQVSGMLFQASLRPIFRNIIDDWDTLDDAGRQAILDQLTAIFQAAEPSPQVAGELDSIGDYLSGKDGTAQTAKFIAALLPRYEAASDPRVAPFAEELRKSVRLLNLPGTKMELEGKYLDGSRLDWSSYRGKVVLVDFWATWCGPCIVELPNVLRNYQAYHDKGFEILGVSLDMYEEHQQVGEFIQRFGIPWKTLVGESPEASFWNHPLTDKFGVSGIPRAILVDRDGVVVSISAHGERLGAQLRELLGEPAVEVTEPAVPAVPQASASETPVPEVARAVAPE